MEKEKVEYYDIEDLEKYPSLKDIFLKIKLYSEKHTGLITLLLSGLTIYFNLCLYSYKLGSYSYYGVDLSYISIGNQTDALMNTLFIISIVGMMIFFNILSYISYCRRFFILYFSLGFVVIYTIFIVQGLIVSEAYNGVIKDIILLGINLLLIWSMFNIFGVAYPNMYSRMPQIYRYKIQIQVLKNNPKKNNKNKIKQCQDKLNKLILEQQKMENIKSSDENKINIKFMSILKMIILVSFPTVLIVILYYAGFFNSFGNTKIDIIQNQIDKEYIYATNEKQYTVNEYSLLYQNSDFMIVSPCVTKNGKIYIFNSYQMKLDKKSFMIQNKYFDKVILCKDNLSLEGCEK